MSQAADTTALPVKKKQRQLFFASPVFNKKYLYPNAGDDDVYRSFANAFAYSAAIQQNTVAPSKGPLRIKCDAIWREKYKGTNMVEAKEQIRRYLSKRLALPLCAIPTKVARREPVNEVAPVSIAQNPVLIPVAIENVIDITNIPKQGDGR